MHCAKLSDKCQLKIRYTNIISNIYFLILCSQDMEFKYLLCGLLGVVFLPSLAHSDVTLTTPSHHTKPIGEDHLLSVLTNMHHSHTFSHLGTNEKIMLVELLAAAEVDAVTHYIDTVGFSKFLLLIDGENTGVLSVHISTCVF